MDTGVGGGVRLVLEYLDTGSKKDLRGSPLPILHTGKQRPRRPVSPCHTVGAAYVPQLVRVRPKSAGHFIQNRFTKPQSLQYQQRPLA